MSGEGPTGGQRALIEACLANGVPFFWRGPGTLLIARLGVPEVLQQVTAQGGTVLGLEGFEMASSDIHSRLDLIRDLSYGTDMPDPLVVLAEWPNNVWVDVTLQVPSSNS